LLYALLTLRLVAASVLTGFLTIGFHNWLLLYRRSRLGAILSRLLTIRVLAPVPTWLAVLRLLLRIGLRLLNNLSGFILG